MTGVVRLVRPVCQSCEQRPATETVAFDGGVKFRVCADCYPTGQAVAS